jgi:hypothetical protein
MRMFKVLQVSWLIAVFFMYDRCTHVGLLILSDPGSIVSVSIRVMVVLTMGDMMNSCVLISSSIW